MVPLRRGSEQLPHLIDGEHESRYFCASSLAFVSSYIPQFPFIQEAGSSVNGCSARIILISLISIPKTWRRADANESIPNLPIKEKTE